MITLTDQERRVLNELVASEYDAFKDIAERFLDAEETEELEAKLQEK